jgi:hypothetical protein
MARVLFLGIAAAAALGAGCVVHGRGQVDIVDVQGYHHSGYYDDQHNWHGGYYDANHGWHDDAPDWHR